MDFPVGKELIAVSCIVSPELYVGDVCLEEVRFMFPDEVIVLKPISDTDEIHVESVAAATEMEEGEPAPWFGSLLGKQLSSVWRCANHRGYEDLIVFAFEGITPNLAFVAEMSVLRPLTLHFIPVADGV